MTTRLEEALKKLTPAEIQQVADYAEYLAGREIKSAAAARGMTLSWRGALSHLRSTYASGVEMQHDYGEWEKAAQE